MTAENLQTNDPELRSLSVGGNIASFTEKDVQQITALLSTGQEKEIGIDNTSLAILETIRARSFQDGYEEEAKAIHNVIFDRIRERHFSKKFNEFDEPMIARLPTASERSSLNIVKASNSKYIDPYTDNNLADASPLHVSKTSKSSFEKAKKRAPKRSRSELPDPSQSPKSHANRTQKAISVRLRPDLPDLAKDYAEELGISRNEWIESLVKRELGIE